MTTTTATPQTPASAPGMPPEVVTRTPVQDVTLPGAGILAPLLNRTHPDIVFYNAGVDPHEEDRLGRLSLSDAGLAERDRRVIEAVRSRGIPLAGVIGGGYGADVEPIARRHALLHHAAAAFAG